MGVYRREGSPFYSIEFIYKGQRIKRSSGVTTKAAAREQEQRLRSELKEQAINGKLPDMSLADALTRYTKTVVKLSRSDGTREVYAFKRIGDALGPETPISLLTAKRIHAWRDALLAEGLKPASINRYLDVLRAVLRKAQSEWGALTVAPTIKALKVQNGKLRFLDEEEERRLVEASPPHLRYLIAFLVGTGARKSEALTLTWDDVDLGSNVRAAVTFKDTKTGKPRRVPLPNQLRDLLTAMKKDAPKDQSRVFLWTNWEGEVVPFDSVKNSFDTARTTAGLKDVTLHTLRHTYASRLVLKGVPIFSVSKLLGHSKIQMTMRYAHLAPEGLEMAVSVLDA